MTENEYYAPADKKISELKASGKNPYSRALALINQAIKTGKASFELKNMYDSKDVMKFKLDLNGSALNLLYDNGVKCYGWTYFGKFTVDSIAESMTRELLAMSYCMDLTWKQYFIDCARANGDDV